MKKSFVLIFLSLFCFNALAQDYSPTINWPYLNPDFFEGEMRMLGNKVSSGVYNIHLGQGMLHRVNNGIIEELSVTQVMSATIGDEEFANVSGKLMKVLAQSEKGIVVEERLADYSQVVREEGGAYGGSNTNAAKSFSYDENYGNYSYLITNDYEDLKSQRDYGEDLPVTVNRYIVIGGFKTLAVKKNVSAIEGVDKKLFAEFLKTEKINWKEPKDILKVLEFVAK